MSNVDVIFKFNNGAGAVLCNRCYVIVKSPAQQSTTANCPHLCVPCFQHLMSLEQAISTVMPIQQEGTIGADISTDDLWDLYVE